MLTSLFSKPKGKDPSGPPANLANPHASPSSPHRSGLQPGVAVKPNYDSVPVAIPATFLAGPAPADATFRQIDFAATALPEYAGCYAAVLDGVLGPAECATLLRLAEASVPSSSSAASASEDPDPSPEAEAEAEAEDPWWPALVSCGSGFEVWTPEYRRSDRIVWDRQEVVDRLWARCVAAAPGLRERLAAVEEPGVVLRAGAGRGGGGGGGGGGRPPPRRWEFRRLNRRMRFLRYRPGDFFKAHCDGASREPGKDVKTFYTLHLYLNDSKQTVGDEAELQGGATSFRSSDEKRKLDVDPKAGRVLIFQHRRLYHSGDDVVAGTKYTMRTDIMYELVRDPAEGSVAGAPSGTTT